MTRHKPDMATLELLAARWPATFSIFEGRRRPLKIGIHVEIQAALAGVVTPAELGLALKVYVGNAVYRSRLVAGAERIDLNGMPAGYVTEKEAARTPKKIPPPPSSKAPPPKVPPAAPRRLSLADLRAAAAARKAAMSS